VIQAIRSADAELTDERRGLKCNLRILKMRKMSGDRDTTMEVIHRFPLSLSKKRTANDHIEMSVWAFRARKRVNPRMETCSKASSSDRESGSLDGRWFRHNRRKTTISSAIIDMDEMTLRGRPVERAGSCVPRILQTCVTRNLCQGLERQHSFQKSGARKICQADSASCRIATALGRVEAHGAESTLASFFVRAHLVGHIICCRVCPRYTVNGWASIL
jgi:hypothetical protein